MCAPSLLHKYCRVCCCCCCFYSKYADIKPANIWGGTKSRRLLPRLMSWTVSEAVSGTELKVSAMLLFEPVNVPRSCSPIFLTFSSAEGPDPCELAQNPRYRKGPDVCFDNNEDVRRRKKRRRCSACGRSLGSD